MALEQIQVLMIDRLSVKQRDDARYRQIGAKWNRRLAAMAREDHQTNADPRADQRRQ